MRGFGLALLMAAFLGLTGCGADNESEADKLQKNLGAPPPGENTTKVEQPVVKDYADYARQKQEAPDPYGAMKKKK